MLKHVFWIGILVLGVVLISGCTSTQNNTTSGTGSGIEIVVTYSGPWNGTIDYGEGPKAVAGNGTQVIKINGTPNRVTADVKKLDASNNTLKLEILNNGKVEKNTTISGPNGGAMVSELFS